MSETGEQGEMGEQTLRLRAAGLEWRTVEGEVVALDMPQETYLGVNRSGSKLWQALAHGAASHELIQLLVSEYGLAQEAAARDVHVFLDALREQGLLEEA